jgi:deazaflavin-dependent oxidoreductase (nitroreductase family)
MLDANGLKDLMTKITTALHRSVYDLSGGRVGGRVGNMPVLELHTTGRKSGKPRVTMLTAPIHDDDRVVLVASYGGDDRHPAWFLNVRDNPEVEITMHGEKRSMNARVATDAEKAELWPEITSAYKGYAGYQNKTERDIPLVILTP